MLKLHFDDSQVHEKKIFVGGFSSYVYNSDVLPLYIQDFNYESDVPPSIPIHVLYLVHHRGGDYTYMRGVASKILTEFQKSCKTPMIAVTFDSRNHGERIVDILRNSGWKSKNDTHAMDMVTCIDGTVLDLKLVIDYLAGYLNLDAFIPQKAKNNGVKVTFNNILSGYSQGAHTVIRFGNRYPKDVSIINPNIGSSDLSSLLVNRLKGTNEYHKKLFYCSYDELGLDDDQKKLYPEAFHRKLSSEDLQVFEEYPFDKIKLFATFYDNDPLVPPAISKLWTDVYLNTNLASAVYYEKGCIHDISESMVDNYVAWLVKNLGDI